MPTAFEVMLTQAQLEAYIAQWQRLCPAPLKLSLEGDLGTGKTTFARLWGKALGVTQRITSPTFVGVNAYPLKGNAAFIHADFYRHGPEGASTLLDELDALAEAHSQAWVCAEWANYCPTWLAEADARLTISADGESRRYHFEALSALGEAWCKALGEANISC